MEFALTPAVLAVVAVVVFTGGFVTGVTGFGFAVIGTAALAVLFDPSLAVVVMILPTLGANLSLVRELDRESLRSCVRRFWPYVLAAGVGTVAGMALLSRIPRGPLMLGLGLFVIGYVLLSQDAVAVPGLGPVLDRCFVETTTAKAGLGLVSGVVFGASNVGVQVVAYLDSLSLPRSTFVGVLAMVFLGISTVRVGVAAALGLYDSAALVGFSALATVPGLAGVRTGQALRDRIPQRVQRVGLFVLLTVIGLRLTTSGLSL